MFSFNLDTSKKQSPNFIPLLWEAKQLTNNNRSEISLDTGYLPCGFAYISRHSHHILFQVFGLADIVHFGLLSPPCTFPGILITRHCISFFLCTFFNCRRRLPSLWVTSAVTSSRHF